MSKPQLGDVVLFTKTGLSQIISTGYRIVPGFVGFVDWYDGRGEWHVRIPGYGTFRLEEYDFVKV